MPEKKLTEQKDIYSRLAMLKDSVGENVSCTVNRDVNGRSVLCGVKNKLLSVDDIGRVFGPGDYDIYVQHEENGETKGLRYNLSVAEDYRGEHEAYKRKQSQQVETKNTGLGGFLPSGDVVGALEKWGPIFGMAQQFFGNSSSSDMKAMLDNQQALLLALIQNQKNESPSENFYLKLLNNQTKMSQQGQPDMFNMMGKMLSFADKIKSHGQPEKEKEGSMDSTIEKIINGVGMLQNKFISPETVMNDETFQMVINQNDSLAKLVEGLVAKVGKSEVIKIADELGILDKVNAILEESPE